MQTVEPFPGLIQFGFQFHKFMDTTHIGHIKNPFLGLVQNFINFLFLIITQGRNMVSGRN